MNNVIYLFLIITLILYLSAIRKLQCPTFHHTLCGVSAIDVVIFLSYLAKCLDILTCGWSVSWVKCYFSHLSHTNWKIKNTWKSYSVFFGEALCQSLKSVDIMLKLKKEVFYCRKNIGLDSIFDCIEIQCILLFKHEVI